MEPVFVGKSPFEADDIKKYEYLNPVWEKLNNVPEGITAEEMWKDLNLDVKKGNDLLKELANEFMQKFINSMKNPLNFLEIATDKFYEKNLRNCWTFDKVMLLVTRVKGGKVEIPDNVVFNKWKTNWLEDKGM